MKGALKLIIKPSAKLFIRHYDIAVVHDPCQAGQEDICLQNFEVISMLAIYVFGSGIGHGSEASIWKATNKFDIVHFLF